MLDNSIQGFVFYHIKNSHANGDKKVKLASQPKWNKICLGVNHIWLVPLPKGNSQMQKLTSKSGKNLAFQFLISLSHVI